MNKFDLETPILLADRRRMLTNIRSMQQVADEADVALRPHIKTHKCPEIAKLQVQEGASGICTQKLGEAEVMVDAGLQDVFITNHVVGSEKIQRLVELQKRATVKVAVDSILNVEQIGNAAVSHNSSVPIVLEVNAGLRSYWCGVPASSAVKLAREISRVRGVHLEGVMTYEGLLPYRIRGIKERKNAVERVVGRLVNSAKRISEVTGQEMKVVSCGATLTARIAATVPGVTEIQPGNFVFYDIEQVGMGSAKLENCALSILTTVTATPSPGRVIVDAGIKAFCHDQGRFPLPINRKDLKPAEIYEEQMVLHCNSKKPQPRVGDKIEFIPYHACTATNMHDRLTIVEDDEVLATWEIAARGKMH